MSIKKFKHKGLKKYFDSKDTSGIKANHAQRLTGMLTALDAASVVLDVDLPGYDYHWWKGKKKKQPKTHSITVSGNWRLTFEFDDGDVYVLNYEDPH